jgi:hypothetical protein
VAHLPCASTFQVLFVLAFAVLMGKSLTPLLPTREILTMVSCPGFLTTTCRFKILLCNSEAQCPLSAHACFIFFVALLNCVESSLQVARAQDGGRVGVLERVRH